MTARNHFYFWAGSFALFMSFVWIFNDVLLPFVLGIAIAYLLDPLVEFLGKWKCSRRVATLLILGLFFILVLAILVLIVPITYREIMHLSEVLPGYIEKIWLILTPYTGWLQEKLNNGALSTFQETLQNNVGNALKVSGGLLEGLMGGGQAIAGFLSVVILTPMVAFFTIKEWPAMTGWVDALLPRKNYDTIKTLLKEIDRKLAGFIRGQLSIAFALALIYACTLTIAGLHFGFLIGLVAGFLSIIPLVGSTVGLLVSISVAWFQTGEWGYVAIIGSIFLVGQFIEGNILTPKLLGKSVGLHPLWILFALMAGGSLFGIVGMLLAVPVAAIIGVLGGFALRTYRDSPYYEQQKEKAKPKRKTTAKKAKAT